MSLSLDSMIPLVLNAFALPGPWKIDSLGSAGGFSGSQLWRIASPFDAYCLKSWPVSQIDVSRLSQIHDWMAQMRHAGLKFVPNVWRTKDGRSCLIWNDRIWDLVGWMPGRPLEQTDVFDSRVAAAIRAVAQVHSVFEPSHEGSQVPESVLRRIRVANQWMDRLASGWRPESSCASDDVIYGAASRLWRSFSRMLPTLPAILEPWRERHLRVFPCLCDVWRAHVLFEGDIVAGVIDYGSMRHDSPATDLARYVGSHSFYTDEAWCAAVNEYRKSQPLSDHEAALAKALAHSGRILAAGAWLVWLLEEKRVFPDLDQVRARLLDLEGQLHSLELSHSIVRSA